MFFILCDAGRRLAARLFFGVAQPPPTPKHRTRTIFAPYFELPMF